MRKFIIVAISLLILGFPKTGFTQELKGNIIKLPPPKLKSSMSLEEAISKRRSERYFISKTLNLSQIAQLFWAGQGITNKRSKYRAAPSAGALYPLELFLVVSEGVYHYNPSFHILEKIVAGDQRSELSKACWGQDYPRRAPCNIVITGICDRTAKKYTDRAKQYVFLEAGHAAQNILLQAVSLGLGAVPVGAFDDKSICKILKVASKHTPLYVISIGYTR